MGLYFSHSRLEELAATPNKYTTTMRYSLIVIYSVVTDLVFDRMSTASVVVWMDFEFNVASSRPTDPRDHFYLHCYHKSVSCTPHISLVTRPKSLELSRIRRA